MSEGISHPSPIDRKPSAGGNIESWKKELSGEASLTRLNRNGRNIRLVAGAHFSSKAAGFFQKEIANEITDPKAWIFLIEGKDTDIHECKVAREIAQKRKIPIFDPVFSISEGSVINLYFRSDPARSVDRDIVMADLAVGFLVVGGDLNSVSELLGVDVTSLNLNIIMANKERERNPEEYSKKIKEIQQSLMNVSNLVSAQVLDYMLRQHPDRSNVAIYLGKAHEGIVSVDIANIPEGMKLNDEEIKEMIQAREEEKVKKLLADAGISLPRRPEQAYSPPRPRTEPNRDSPKNKASKILDEMSDVPDVLKSLIVEWSKDLFVSDRTIKEGYQKYLNSDDSLHQIWGAGALLADKVDKAKEENRNLTPEEILEIQSAFMRAASTRKVAHNGFYKKEGEELADIANGVEILVKVMQKW